MYVTLWVKISKLSHDTKRYLKDKTKNLNRAPQWHIHFVGNSWVPHVMVRRLDFLSIASLLFTVVSCHETQLIIFDFSPLLL